MSFCWSDFLEIAKLLKKETRFPQAAFRTSLSRAYYSIYHQTSSYAAEQGFNVNLPDSHKRLKVFLREHSSQKNNNRIMAKFEKLYQFRIDSDYHKDKLTALDANVVEQAINHAENILSILSPKK